MATLPDSAPSRYGVQGKEYAFHFFSDLVKRRICVGKINNVIGKLTDLVFRLSEPYPDAAGILIDHGWGKPTEFVPYGQVVKIDPDAVFVQPAPGGGQYPPFVDQPGWMLLNEHLMGKTILDMDGRQIEVVNDVHLLESKGRMIIVHVDTSFNGFLRKLSVGREPLTLWEIVRHPLRTALRIAWAKDQFISWRYVQPLSLEDAVATDRVSLSIARKQIKELPSEDLADALEQLSGKEQQAVFSALDSEKAAETLMEAEPRAQRQIIASLRLERARTILSQMSVVQLADLFSVLPHEDKIELLGLLPKEQAERVNLLLSEQESTAGTLMHSNYLALPRETTVADALRTLRSTRPDSRIISYIYVVGPEKLLLGVVDLRDAILAPEATMLGEVMVSPVVTAEADDLREDLAGMFAKYHYRMLPVVDAQDHLLGVIRHKDIAK